MTQAVTFDDVWKMFQETDRKFQEMVREDRERRVETDRTFQEMSAETDRQFKATDIKIKEVSTLVGNLGGRWGEFVEGLVAPACETLFAQRGIPVHKISRNVKAKLPGIVPVK